MTNQRMNHSLSLHCSSEYSLEGNQTLAALLVGFNILTSPIGIIGNLLVCTTVFAAQRKNSSFHFFISSLAVSDLTIAALCQPLLLVLILNQMKSECLPSLFFIFRMFANCAYPVSVLTVALIALDRCLFVTSAGSGKFKYRNTMTARKKIALAVTWVFGCVYSGMRLALEQKITLFIYTAVSALCCVTVIVYYAVIYYHFLKYKKLVKSPLNKTRHDNAQPENTTTENNLFALTIILLVLNYALGQVLLFYISFAQPKENKGFMYYAAVTAEMSTTAMNPLLYCFSNKEYRRLLKKILSKLSHVFHKKRADKSTKLKSIKEMISMNLKGGWSSFG